MDTPIPLPPPARSGPLKIVVSPVRFRASPYILAKSHYRGLSRLTAPVEKLGRLTVQSVQN